VLSYLSQSDDGADNVVSWCSGQTTRGSRVQPRNKTYIHPVHVNQAFSTVHTLTKRLIFKADFFQIQVNQINHQKGEKQTRIGQLFQ